MSYVDFLRESIEDSIRRVEQDLQWIEENAPRIAETLIDHAVDQQWWLPQWGKDELKERLTGDVAQFVTTPLTENARLIRTCLAQVRAGLAYVGSPDTLRAAADRIDDGVVSSSQELAPTLVLGNIPSSSTSNWSDDEASDGYVRKIDGRSEAVQTGSENAATVATGLRNSAKNIEDFLIALAELVAGLVGVVAGIVTAIVGAATVVLLIAGIVGAIAGVASLVAGIVKLISSTGQGVDEALRNLSPEIHPWIEVF